MKKIEFTLLILSIIISLDSYSQEFEWIVHNTNSNPGERIVAIIDAGSIGSYEGVGITGTVTDYNGNWGQNYPTLSEFTAYVKFSSNLSYGIIQEKSTTNIQLRIRKISNSIIHLTANLPNSHRGVRVNFKKVIGSPSVVMGNPLVNDSSGELLLEKPIYNSVSITNNGIGTLQVSSNSIENQSTSSLDANLIIKGTDNGRVIEKGAALGFAVSSKTDGSSYWQQGRILVTPDNTNNYNASGRMYLQARYLNSGSWKWRNNLVLLSSGYVGIGTEDTKGFELGVKGRIIAEEVKIALFDNWPDFVFKKEYKLPTLKEVENHIKEKGHLKDIPNAKEVEENGIFLGEMDAKLLQKIEELTLYTIQQQKEIETLKTMNSKLLKLHKRLEELEKK